MAGTDENQQATTTDNHPPGAAAKPTETPPIAEPAKPVVIEEPNGSDGKVVQVQHSDFKKIKEEAKEKGRREALAELDTVAVKYGFSSHESALEALAALNKKPPAPEPKTAPPPTETQMPKPTEKKPDDRAADKAAREAQRLADERGKLRKDWRTSQRKQRDLQRQLDAKDAEKDLIIEMTKLGVQDLDYGMRLLTRELAGKSEEEIKNYDRKAFFEKVRQEKPYLFGETVVPATTGTNGTKPDGSNPAAPNAAKPVVDAAQQNQFDARKATREQFEDRLKALGLNPNNT